MGAAPAAALPPALQAAYLLALLGTLALFLVLLWLPREPPWCLVWPAIAAGGLLVALSLLFLR